MGAQIVKFIFVGVLGAVTEIGVFMLLIKYGLSLVFANAIAFNLALIQCFIANRYFTFGLRGGALRLKSFTIFLIYMYLQLIIGTTVLWILIKEFQMTELISKIIQLGCLTPISFLFQKYFIFKSK
jgi:putative flippase GtrA